MKKLNTILIVLCFVSGCAGPVPQSTLERNPSAEIDTARPQDFRDYYPNYFLGKAYWRKYFPSEIPTDEIEEGFNKFEATIDSVLKRLVMRDMEVEGRVYLYRGINLIVKQKDPGARVLLRGELLSSIVNHIYDEIAGGKSLDEIRDSDGDIPLSKLRRPIKELRIGLDNLSVGSEEIQAELKAFFKLTKKSRDPLNVPFELRDLQSDMKALEEKKGKMELFYFDPEKGTFTVEDEAMKKKLTSFVAETALLSKISQLDPAKSQKKFTLLGWKETGPQREFIPVSWYENKDSLTEFVTRVEEKRTSYIPTYSFYIQKHYEFLAKTIPHYEKEAVADMLEASLRGKYPGVHTYFAAAFLKSISEETPWMQTDKKVRKLCFSLLEISNNDLAAQAAIKVLNRDLTDGVIEAYISSMHATRFPDGSLAKIEAYKTIKDYLGLRSSARISDFADIIRAKGDPRLKVEVIEMIMEKHPYVLIIPAMRALVKSVVKDPYYKDTGSIAIRAAMKLGSVDYFEDVLKKYVSGSGPMDNVLEFLHSFHKLPKEFQEKVMKSYLAGEKTYPQGAFRILAGNVLTHNPDLLPEGQTKKAAEILMDTVTPIDIHFLITVLKRGSDYPSMKLLYNVSSSVGSLRFANNTVTLYHEALKNVFLRMGFEEKTLFIESLKGGMGYPRSEAFLSVVDAISESEPRLLNDDFLTKAMKEEERLRNSEYGMKVAAKYLNTKGPNAGLLKVDCFKATSVFIK